MLKEDHRLIVTYLVFILLLTDLQNISLFIGK